MLLFILMFYLTVDKIGKQESKGEVTFEFVRLS